MSRASVTKLLYCATRASMTTGARYVFGKGQKMTVPFSAETTEMDSDSLKELASIARLITYARQSAKELNAEFPVWCLDLALGAVLQEMYSGGEKPPLFEDSSETPSATARH